MVRIRWSRSATIEGDNMKIDVTYCRKCGSKLELFVKGHYFYDSNDGSAYFRAELRCPNKKRSLLDSHSRFKGSYNDKVGTLFI